MTRQVSMVHNYMETLIGISWDSDFIFGSLYAKHLLQFVISVL